MADISQEQYEKYRQKLKQMRMLDDTLMKCVFKDCKPAVEQMLRIILSRDDLIVESFTIGKEYKNLRGHSICMDVLAVDKDGKHYNIEVQRDDRGADPRRGRFYAGMMDVEMLGKGDDYSTLRDSYVIFITENDIFKEGKPLYHYIRTEEESGKPLGDGSHIIYVNGAYVGDGPLGWLISDFREPDPKKIHIAIFAERLNYFKNNIKGEKEMCKIMEELVEEGRQEGIQKGIQKGRLEGIQEGRLEGIQKGIQVTIKLYRQLGLSNEEIIKQISVEYEIPQSEAAKYVYVE
ncbi:MAG: PD-(D/E)XK nuclease family transposase [Verrucomicrobia bacterium]|nr:PD-(D/E)XK nuclease family transposase [Verrucomicrobiota bacterium]